MLENHMKLCVWHSQIFWKMSFWKFSENSFQNFPVTYKRISVSVLCQVFCIRFEIIPYTNFTLFLYIFPGYKLFLYLSLLTLKSFKVLFFRITAIFLSSLYINYFSCTAQDSCRCDQWVSYDSIFQSIVVAN